MDTSTELSTCPEGLAQDGKDLEKQFVRIIRTRFAQLFHASDDLVERHLARDRLELVAHRQVAARRDLHRTERGRVLRERIGSRHCAPSSFGVTGVAQVFAERMTSTPFSSVTETPIV